MDSAWLCVVLNKNLCTKGADYAFKEMKRLTGDSFVDFKMVDDGFDNDCYSFIKCSTNTDSFMNDFRKNSNIVTVLDSYDKPTLLSDDEVLSFINDGEKEELGTKYGDMVLVEGSGHYSGLHGVVIDGGTVESEVLFRFHTITKRKILKNEELNLIGNVFKRLKIPVTNVILMEGRIKFPVIKKRK